MSTSKRVIVIDPGHGGRDSGAVGPRGLREAAVNLAVALLLEDLLKPVFSVVLTRKTDVFVELAARARKSNDAGADAFLSIHCNSGPPGRGDGFEVFTCPGLTASDRMATDLFIAYAEAFPTKRKRMDLSDGDPDKEERFTVLTRTRCRAVLFELEFIHTQAGERWLEDPANQAACARALAKGLRNHFNIP